MTSSSNLTNTGEQRFRSLAFLAILIIYLLILAGGIVRSTGSGMGCPDWPTCFGQWIPPTTASQLPAHYQEIYGAKLKGEVEFNAVKTWIEYINRLLGVLSGLFVFATLVASFSYLRKDKTIVWGSVAAFLLIGANGWLGSRVVATELAQYLITLHLLLAIMVVFSLLFVYVRAYAGSRDIKIDKAGRAVVWLLLITMVLSLGQVLLGTQVRDALDEVVHRIGYGQRDNWIVNLDWRFYVHRTWSLVVLVFHLLVIYKLNQAVKAGVINSLMKWLVGLVVLEIATGAIMAYFAVPSAAQPIHLFLAVVMMGMQFVIWLLLSPQLNSSKQVANQARFQQA